MHGSSLPSGKSFLFLSYVSSVLFGHRLKTQQGNKLGSFLLSSSFSHGYMMLFSMFLQKFKVPSNSQNLG